MPPLWRTLFMIAASDILPFTRKGFGNAYVWQLVVALFTKQTLLLPFPAAQVYSLYGVVVTVFLIGHCLHAMATNDEPRPRYFSGLPSKFGYAQERTPRFLFVIEPFVAFCLAVFFYVARDSSLPYYYPSYILVPYYFGMQIDTSLIDPYVNWMQHRMIGIPDYSLYSIAFLMPIALLLNNISEYVEAARNQGAAMPERGQATLSFPEVS